MHNIKGIESAKKQAQRHRSHVKRTVELDMERHILLCEDLLHCYTTGDTSLLKDFVVLLDNTATRTATIREWIGKFSGQQIRIDGEKWFMRKGWSRDKFDLEGAENAPYWTLRPEKAEKKLSWEVIFGMLKGQLKRIDTADAKDSFNGDPEKVKALLGEVISFADVKAKKLSAQELGIVSNQADELLRNQSSTNVPAAVAAADQTGEEVPVTATIEEPVVEEPLAEAVNQ